MIRYQKQTMTTLALQSQRVKVIAGSCRARGFCGGIAGYNSSCHHRRFLSAASVTHTQPLVMGCVSYGPTVDEIWSGIREYLVHDCLLPFEYRLFDSYEDQVHALVTARTIDVAWNGPVAHVMAESAVHMTTHPLAPSQVVSLGMRDVDQDFESIVVVRRDACIASSSSSSTTEDFTAIPEHRRHLVTGSRDSPQACIVPYYHLTEELGIRFSHVTHFDADMGTHGDTAVGEIRAMEALSRRREQNQADRGGDVAIVSRMMWDRALGGQLPSIDPVQLRGTCKELAAVRLPPFDHCQFDAILPIKEDSADGIDKAARLRDFGEAILGMKWEDPKHHHLMSLEGIQQEWKYPRQEGYDIVRKAMLGGSNSAAFANHRSATNFQYQSKRSFSSSSASGSHGQVPPQKRVAVIGAGVAGLQTVRAMKGRGLDVTAFEASPKVGGLWKSNYSNFGVQVPKQLYEFQDYPMTQLRWGEYASGPQVQEYIESYATDFGLVDSIRCNTKVTKTTPVISESGSNVGWKIETQSVDGTTKEDDFDYLVVATGMYSSHKKFIPSKPRQDGFHGDIVHSSDFCDATAANGKDVVVIGGGKSAVDCAIQAAKAGASSVTLVQRTAHWPTPQKIAGVIPFQYVFLSRLGTALVSIHRGTYPGSGTVVNAIRNSGLGPLLMVPVFRLVEELFAFQFGLKGDLRPKGDVVTDFYKVAMVLDSEFAQMRKEGKIGVKLGEIEEYGSDGKSVLLKDGSSQPSDLVIAATGFSQDYSYFSDPATVEALDIQKDGLYLYNYILPEKVPNLAFIGNVGAISNVSSYGLQAEWLARHLTGGLLPSDRKWEEVAKHEIEARKKWARSWMPESSNRGMLLLLHQTHYHDKLLKEMGMNPHRKSNPIFEYLMPYEPADYDGVMGGAVMK